MAFPENLKKLRLQRGYTQEKLARLLYVDRTSISRYEAGTLEPSISMLVEISRIFNISIDRLIE